MDKIERNNEPTIFTLSDDDKEMNNAIKTAKNTLSDFDFALKNPENKDFALKMNFEHENGSEYIWITNIEKDENEYYGIVDNLPNTIKCVKPGEKIKIPIEKISDWMYSKNGILIGGFTIKTIRNRLSKSEKEQFDKEFTLKIE